MRYPTQSDTGTESINMNPPISGVPSLDLCHAGPISSICEPALSFLRYGMSITPKSAATMSDRNPTIKFIQNGII